MFIVISVRCNDSVLLWLPVLLREGLEPFEDDIARDKAVSCRSWVV